MADPLQTIGIGEISPFVKSAATVNESLHWLRNYRRQQGRGRVGALPVDPNAYTAPEIILVRNDTQQDLNTFDVVQLNIFGGATGALLTPQPEADEPDLSSALYAGRNPVYAGTIPTNLDLPIAILQEPVPYPGGGIETFGRAVFRGITPARIFIAPGSHHNWAIPTPNDKSRLTGTESNALAGLGSSGYPATGKVRVLWYPGGSQDTKLCLVHLGEYDDHDWNDNCTAGTYTITSSGAWQDTGFETQIPRPGAYMIFGNVEARGVKSALGGDDQILCRIYDETDSATLWAGTIVTVGVITNNFRGMVNPTIVRSWGPSHTYPHVIRLDAYRSTGGTWTTSTINPQPIDSTSAKDVGLGYIRLADRYN